MSVAHNHHHQVVYLSLHILKGVCDVNTGVQEDSDSFDVWALLTLFRISRDLQDSVGKLIVEELQKKVIMC